MRQMKPDAIADAATTMQQTVELATLYALAGDGVNAAFVAWVRELGHVPTWGEFAAWAGVDGDEWTVESEWRA
jgi:hypothetical protein